jgi:chemotaxis protein MotB
MSPVFLNETALASCSVAPRHWSTAREESTSERTMARKAAWEDAGDADLGPYGKPSGTRWGRVFVGLLLVAAGTFVAAYYLPLYRAQQKLGQQYRELQQRAAGLSNTVDKTTAELTSASKERDELKTARDEQQVATETAQQQQQSLRAELAGKLDKVLKKGGGAVVASERSVVVALNEALLFAPQKLVLSPQAKPLLCDIAKIAGSHFIRVHVTTADGATASTPASASSSVNPWALSAERAAAIAGALAQQCSFPAAQLSATGDAARDPFAAQLASTMLSVGRVELEVTQP